MKTDSKQVRDLEKERDDILKFAEAQMTPELRLALEVAQNLPPPKPTQTIETTFTESTNADSE